MNLQADICNCSAALWDVYKKFWNTVMGALSGIASDILGPEDSFT